MKCQFAACEVCSCLLKVVYSLKKVQVKKRTVTELIFKYEKKNHSVQWYFSSNFSHYSYIERWLAISQANAIQMFEQCHFSLFPWISQLFIRSSIISYYSIVKQYFCRINEFYGLNSTFKKMIEKMNQNYVNESKVSAKFDWNSRVCFSYPLIHLKY